MDWYPALISCFYIIIIIISHFTDSGHLQWLWRFLCGCYCIVVACIVRLMSAFQFIYLASLSEHNKNNLYIFFNHFFIVPHEMYAMPVVVPVPRYSMSNQNNYLLWVRWVRERWSNHSGLFKANRKLYINVMNYTQAYSCIWFPAVTAPN